MTEINSTVIRDARLMLEKAARILKKLEHADTATAANQRLLSEAMANIHAAEARIKR